MKTIRVVVIILRILVLILSGLFVYLTLCGLAGDVMTTNGIILLGLLLCTRYLSKLYDKYMEDFKKKRGGNINAPLEFCDRWGFSPINFLDRRFDAYVRELVNFTMSSDDTAVFVPNEAQRFYIWWDDYAEAQGCQTGQITKMSHTPDHKILFETSTGAYVGYPKMCDDLDLGDRSE